jgi:hypothetical protein
VSPEGRKKRKGSFSFHSEVVPPELPGIKLPLEFSNFPRLLEKFGVRGPARKSRSCPDTKERDRSRFAQSKIY